MKKNSNANDEDKSFPDIIPKQKLQGYYFLDPKTKKLERQFTESKVEYFYFDEDLDIATKKGEILNGCLLAGKSQLIFQGEEYPLDLFDLFFIPPEKSVHIQCENSFPLKNKLCLYSYRLDAEITADFEIQHYSPDKFLPRGEPSSNEKMATYRTVWTAIKNNYFMSGFTNIPNSSLHQGVITSVNLELTEEGKTEIHPHIHPGFPEVYIMCIDDDYYAISQYLINTKGESICQDLSNGDGLFFPGNLGHCNFARPFYKNPQYCMYLWIIPTKGKSATVAPITLDV